MWLKIVFFKQPFILPIFQVIISPYILKKKKIILCMWISSNLEISIQIFPFLTAISMLFYFHSFRFRFFFPHVLMNFSFWVVLVGSWMMIVWKICCFCTSLCLHATLGPFGKTREIKMEKDFGWNERHKLLVAIVTRENILFWRKCQFMSDNWIYEKAILVLSLQTRERWCSYKYFHGTFISCTCAVLVFTLFLLEVLEVSNYHCNMWYNHLCFI